MVRLCVVPKCNSRYRNDGRKVSIFKVPDNVDTLKKWEVAIPGLKKPLKSSHCICEKHFDKNYIIRKYVKHDADGKLIAEVNFL